MSSLCGPSAAGERVIAMVTAFLPRHPPRVTVKEHV